MFARPLRGHGCGRRHRSVQLPPDLGGRLVRPLAVAHRIAGRIVFQQLLDLSDYLGRFFPRASGHHRVSVRAPFPQAGLGVVFVRGPRSAIQLQQLGQLLVTPAAELQGFQASIQTALLLVQQASEQDQRGL